ncbi:MAG: hypothetical protein ABH883_03640 [Candidatus Omnitrophota bacterium]
MRKILFYAVFCSMLLSFCRYAPADTDNAREASLTNDELSDTERRLDIMRERIREEKKTGDPADEEENAESMGPEEEEE